MSNIRKMSLMTFFHNVYRLFVYDDRETYVCLENDTIELNLLRKKVKGYEVALNYLCDALGKDKLEHFEELKYIIENGYDNFPYKQLKKNEDCISGYDKNKQLPFVIHNGKKLFFPHTFSVDRAIFNYKNFIERECILGGTFTEKSPHQYQTDDFLIEKGDIMVDVGCAEALLTLDSIDKISHAYLIEGDPKWIPALEATFEPYKNKVSIINKYVGNNSNEFSLESIINENQGSIFVKMDIEGAEIPVIKSIANAIKNRSNIKISCCTYHHSNDYEEIGSILQNIGYKVTSSDGYMLFDCYGAPIFPYFRKGLIRALKVI